MISAETIKKLKLTREINQPLSSEEMFNDVEIDNEHRLGKSSSSIDAAYEIVKRASSNLDVSKIVLNF